jgi:hypothetical protein
MATAAISSYLQYTGRLRILLLPLEYEYCDTSPPPSTPGAFAPALADWEEPNIQPIRNKEELKNKSSLVPECGEILESGR